MENTMNPGGSFPPEMLHEETTVGPVEEPTEEMQETDPEYGDRAPGEINAEADQELSPVDGHSDSPFQSVEKVAREVAEGRWGIGQSRRTALKRAGYDPNEVEAELTKIRNRR